MAGVFVFLAAFAAYAWTVSPAAGWLDSPEFVAAAVGLGVPHSPGHPLPVLLGKLGALIPIGDLATRVNLMSALAAAGASAALYRAIECLLSAADSGHDTVPSAARRLIAAALALGFALSGAAWLQAVRAEVYALHSLWFALTAWAAVAYATGAAGGTEDAAGARGAKGDGRGLLAGGLLAGLALATHHLIALTFLAPLIILLIARRQGGRGLSVALLLMVVGLAALLYLPVRSAQHPEVNWGAPHTAERFGWTISARAFHKATTQEHVSSPGQDAAQVVLVLAEQSAWPVAAALGLAAMLGLYIGLRQRGSRAVTGYLAAVVGLCCAARVLIGFDPDTPDHQGYLLPALGALAMLSASGIAAVWSLLSPARAGPRPHPVHRVVGVALVLAAAAPQLVRTLPEVRTGSASDRWAGWELDAVPPRSVLIASYFQTSFRLMAERAVAAARPDVAILDRSFLTYPGAAAEARLRYPALAALIDAPLVAGSPTPIAQLTELTRSRPVLMQLHINLEPAVDPWLVPLGPYAYLAPVPASEVGRQRAEVRDLAARAARANPRADARPGARQGARDPQRRHHLTPRRGYLRMGRAHAARAVLDRAWALAPGDASLRAAAEQCGLRSAVDAIESPR
ncbi:MAG: DUF2723 domain-containing protein [Myxococcota bacterium]